MKYNKNEVTGKMRDRIILQNVTRSRSLTGFASESWADTTTIWAFAESKLPGSNENIIDGKNTAKNVCDFTIRYLSTISEESRVVFKNKIYQVKNIKVSHDRRFISFQGVYYDSYSIVIGLQSCSASLLAQSSLSAALMRIIKYQASLNAFGSVSADIALVQKVASSLNANASLVSDINFVQKAQASLLTSASVSGDITIPKIFNASLLATGTTTADLTVGADDAAAFFARVTAAGGTLTTTEQNAIITLVSQLKADGIWTKMKAIYPMVGASAAACAQNLKSSSFTATFTSGWTFASTGVKGNGTSAYMNTGLNPSSNLILDDLSFSYYCRTNNATYAYDCGVTTTTTGTNLSLNTALRYFNNFIYYSLFHNPTELSKSQINSAKYFIFNKPSSTSVNLFENTTKTTSSITNRSLANGNFYLGARSLNGNASDYSDKECALLTIGNSLSDAEASNLYTAVQAFQTTLNRQV